MKFDKSFDMKSGFSYAFLVGIWYQPRRAILSAPFSTDFGQFDVFHYRNVFWFFIVTSGYTESFEFPSFQERRLVIGMLIVLDPYI